ncbi:MAG TPA: hypothetical protein VGL24_14220 [Chthoniobacterales bacterium]
MPKVETPMPRRAMRPPRWISTGIQWVNDQSDAAQAQTNKEEEDVSALYAEGHALAVDICDTVEFNVRQDPSASSRRAKARKWGVVYVNDDGTLAEDPLPPGEPPVTPPPA